MCSMLEALSPARQQFLSFSSLGAIVRDLPKGLIRHPLLGVLGVMGRHPLFPISLLIDDHEDVEVRTSPSLSIMNHERTAVIHQTQDGDDAVSKLPGQQQLSCSVSAPPCGSSAVLQQTRRLERGEPEEASSQHRHHQRGASMTSSVTHTDAVLSWRSAVNHIY